MQRTCSKEQLLPTYLKQMLVEHLRSPGSFMFMSSAWQTRHNLPCPRRPVTTPSTANIWRRKQWSLTTHSLGGHTVHKPASQMQLLPTCLKQIAEASRMPSAVDLRPRPRRQVITQSTAHMNLEWKMVKLVQRFKAKCFRHNEKYQDLWKRG